MNRWLPYLSLFTSASTLVCCALPALFVALGLGAVFAGVVSNVPGLIWMSEHKVWLFSVAAILLGIAGLAQIRAKNEACPLDPKLALACDRARLWSKRVYLFSVLIFATGAVFAFGSGRIF